MLRTPNARSVFNEALDLLCTNPRYSPYADALRRSPSVQNTVHQGSKDASQISATRFRSLANPQSLRSFSTSTLSSKSRFSGSTNHTQRRMQSTSNNLLAHMESTANNNPQSASAQNAFYASLLRGGYPDVLVERYETGRYATNAACDALYTRAVDRLNNQTAGSQSQGQGHAMAQGARGMDQSQMGAIGRAVAASTQRGKSTVSMRPGQTGNGQMGYPLHVVVDESRKAFVFKVAKFLLLFGVVGYTAMMLLTYAFEATGVFRGGKNGGQNAEVKPEEQKTRFADVKGCDEAIEEMQEIVDFLRQPEKYNKLGGKLPKGVLMVGPPGTGKTLLARAVAGEAGVPFFYMSGSEFDEVYVGVGAKRVRELFTNAKAKAPAIVFIDELDAVGGKRNERDAAYHMQTLNQMLTELDGFDQTSGVVFIGATNFPQMLDKALTRPGRFDRQVVVPLPDVRGRMAILKYHMREMTLESNIDPTIIARGTPGFSGADIENLVNQAAVHASKNNAKKIGMGDLDWARDRILMGAEKRTMFIQDKDKLMTAYHEAGHALMAHYNNASDPLYKITILPRGQALGVTHFMPDMDKVSQSKRECLAMIDRAMGGKIAEEIIYGVDEVTSGCSSDLSNATSIAYAMVKEWGMSDALGSIAFDDRTYASLSTETKQKVEAEVRRILDESQERARVLLGSKKKELKLLADGLMKHETLTKDQMAKVIEGQALPGPEVESKSEEGSGSGGIGMPPIKLPEIPPLPGFGGSGGDGSGGPPAMPGTEGAGQ